MHTAGQRAPILVQVVGADHQVCRQALAEDEEKQMREYRAQLDADRAQRLSHGVNHADKRLTAKDQGVKKQKSDSKRHKHKKDKDKKDKKAKKTKKRTHDSSSSPGSSKDNGMAATHAHASGPVRLSDFLR